MSDVCCESKFFCLSVFFVFYCVAYGSGAVVGGRKRADGCVAEFDRENGGVKIKIVQKGGLRIADQGSCRGAYHVCGNMVFF